MLSKTISIAKAAKTTVTCPFCVYVWELWFVRIIHSQTRSFNPLEQSFSSLEPDLAYLCKSCCMFLQWQIRFSMHIIKKRKAGTIPKNVLNCWIDLFFWFFSFHLAFSSCGSLLYLLQEDCRQYWVPAYCEDTLAGQTIPVVLKAHPVLPA